jgi:hypothetical protein
LGSFHPELAGAAKAWAVGAYNGQGGAQLPLILQWNGTSWKQVTSPNPGGTGGSSLNAVSAASATSAWAVGDYGAPGLSFILHWNGTSWKQVTSPNPGGTTGGTSLTAVSAASATSAWAVGTFHLSGKLSRSLTLHWNGTTWKKVTSANPGTQYTGLNGVSAGPAGSAWAAGSFLTSSAPSVSPWPKAGTAPDGRTPPALTPTRTATSSSRLAP